MKDWYEICECCGAKHVLRNLHGFDLCSACEAKAEKLARDAVVEWVAENKQ